MRCSLSLTRAECRHESKTVAQQTKEPFEGVKKSFYDDFDRQGYVAFWEEYERLLDQATTV